MHNLKKWKLETNDFFVDDNGGNGAGNAAGSSGSGCGGSCSSGGSGGCGCWSRCGVLGVLMLGVKW